MRRRKTPNRKGLTETLNNCQEIAMNNTVTSKLAAMGVALVMNSFLLVSVGYLFNKEAQADTQAAYIPMTRGHPDPVLAQNDVK
jgi:hypothetical protein